MGECDRLLIMLTVQMLRGPRQPLDGTVEQIAALVNRLRVHYAEAGLPYGNHQQGFQRWLLDHWPAADGVIRRYAMVNVSCPA